MRRSLVARLVDIGGEVPTTLLAMSTWPGWISVLPSKPYSTPCRHSSLKPSRSFTSLYTPSRTTLPAARAAINAWARCGSSARRPAVNGTRNSRARSLVPITNTDTRCVSSDGSHIEDCCRSLDHRPHRHRCRRAGVVEPTRHLIEILDRVDLRHDDRGRGRLGYRGEIVCAPRGVEAVAADRQLRVAILSRRRGRAAACRERPAWRRALPRPRDRR